MTGIPPLAGSPAPGPMLTPPLTLTSPTAGTPQGLVPGVVAAVLAAVAGAVSSFVAYQKKKLCFREGGGEGGVKGSRWAGLGVDIMQFMWEGAGRAQWCNDFRAWQTGFRGRRGRGDPAPSFPPPCLSVPPPQAPPLCRACVAQAASALPDVTAMSSSPTGCDL